MNLALEWFYYQQFNYYDALIASGYINLEEK